MYPEKMFMLPKDIMLIKFKSIYFLGCELPSEGNEIFSPTGANQKTSSENEIHFSIYIL